MVVFHCILFPVYWAWRERLFICKLRVSHCRIPVCEGFGLVNIMAEWRVQQPVLASQCVKGSKSVVEVQRAFHRGFGNDRGRGPVLTRKTVPSCASKWRETASVRNVQKPDFKQSAHPPPPKKKNASLKIATAKPTSFSKKARINTQSLFSKQLEFCKILHPGVYTFS